MRIWKTGKVQRDTASTKKIAFYNKLNMKGINYNDHDHAQRICNTIEKIL